MYFSKYQPHLNLACFSVQFAGGSAYLVAEKIWYSIKNYQTFKDKNWKKSLMYLSNLFSYRVLPIDIQNHLIEIIINDKNYFDRENVYKLWSSCIENFLKCQFLLTYDVEKKLTPLDTILSVFTGYWIIVSTLNISIGKKENIIPSEYKKEFINLLRLIKRDDLDLIHINLAYQDFSGTNFSNLQLNGIDLSFANLSKVNFQGTNIRSANLEGTNLEKADLRNTDFRNTTLDKVNLNFTQLDGMKISDNLIEDKVVIEDFKIGRRMRELYRKGGDHRNVFIEKPEEWEAKVKELKRRGKSLNRYNLLNELEKIGIIGLEYITQHYEISLKELASDLNGSYFVIKNK